MYLFSLSNNVPVTGIVFVNSENSDYKIAVQTGPCFHCSHKSTNTFISGFIHVREMSVRFNFFQGLGIVREFCDVSGKNEILHKCQGNVREFYIAA